MTGQKSAGCILSKKEKGKKVAGYWLLVLIEIQLEKQLATSNKHQTA
jgi:hypothetical protein